jgi:NAD+ synthase
MSVSFSKEVLAIDAAREVDRITAAIEDIVVRRLRRRGAVVGLSGGIDSTVVAALCARALGPGRVLGLTMHERESSGETRALSLLAARHLGVACVEEDITPILEAAGCYRRRDAAIRSVLPDAGGSFRSKIVLPSVVESDSLRVFSVIVETDDGRTLRARLPHRAYLELVASTSFKQRTRKMLEYYHADACSYAVAGTPNLLEYDQGFFVKNGDGAADLKPIAHLYKTQVYALAAALGVPDEIRSRPPTTDTYSLPQSQEELYFSLSYDRMDLCLYARDHGVTAAEAAAALGLTPEQVLRVYQDIDRKRAVARYLHAPPITLEEGEAGRAVKG